MKKIHITALRKKNTMRFILGIGGTMLVLFVSSIDSFLGLFSTTTLVESGYHFSVLTEAMLSNSFSSFLPIFSVIPFSGNYTDEVKTQFSRFLVQRTSYSSYLLDHLISCFILGGTSILCGILLMCFFCTLICTPIERASVNEVSQLPNFFEHCFLAFVSGGFWALLGMTMSTVMESKYIAYASPFVVYYLLVILYERYFPNAYLIYPREWLNPSPNWPLGIWGVAILLLELTALLGLVFYRRGKRRLEQL